MTIETILEYLNAVPVRTTYGAVGEVLGVRPQVVPRLLGARRPEASWIVNGGTGDPTGYTPDEVDPRLAGTHVIRSGDELRRCLERHAAAAPDAVSTTDAVGVQETPETAVGVRETPETPETEAVAMGSETKWIIGTVVPAVLLVAALLSAQIASMSGSLNTRIDDVNDRIEGLQADLTAQIADVHTRIDELRTELGEEIAVLRSDVRSFDARLRAVELELGPVAPDFVPAPAGDEQTPDSAAPVVSPEPQPEPPSDPAAPVASPEPQGEPASDPAAPVASPEPQPEPASDPAAPAVNPEPQPEPASDPAAPVVNPDPPRE